MNTLKLLSAFPFGKSTARDERRDHPSVSIRISCYSQSLVAFTLLMAFGTASLAADPKATVLSVNESTPNFTQVLDFDIATDLDQPFNEGGIARSTTIFNSALQKNPNARANQGRVMVLIEPEQRGTGDSQGGAFLEQYTFADWQYVDRFIDWGGTSEGNIKIPRSGWIDAAHRNGVKIYGNIFLAPIAFGGTVDHVEYLVQKDPNGSFPVANRLIEIAETQGFDGYFLNQEVNGVGSSIAEQVGEFMDYVQANSDIELSWYDAQTEAGFVGWQEQLNSQNDRFFHHNGQVVSESMFLDFGASASKLASSKLVANNLGRSEFDLYAGALLEGGGIAAGAGQLLASFSGPGGNHRSSLGLFRPDNAPWWAATAGAEFNIQAMIDEDKKTYVGANADPSDTTNPVSGTNWQGIAHYVAAKSPLVQDTFMTNFNYGLGHKYAIEGQISNPEEWNNIGLQDVLPTWRWIVSTGDPTPLDVEFDFDNPFHGGSSIRFSGTLDNDTTVPLYLSQIPIHSDSKLSLTFTTGEVGFSAAEVRVSFVGNEGNYISYPLGSTTSSGWNTSTLNLNSFAGQTIASIGMKFVNNGDQDYRFNLGRLGVIRGDVDKPAAPTNVNAQSVAFSSATEADVRLEWDHSADYSRDANNEIYNYNVFRQSQGGRRFLGGAATNAYFVKGLTREDSELVTVLEIEALGNEFGVSDVDEYKVRWESTAVVTIDRGTGEIKLVNPLASSTSISSYTISSPGGSFLTNDWESLSDQGLPGWQETAATTNLLSEMVVGSPLQMVSDDEIGLGQAYARTELAFGVDAPEENVAFEYTSNSSTVQSNVYFVGESSNNLTLYIDPVTGNALLQNTSTFDAEIDGYWVLSEGGSLNPAAWQSLEDQSLPSWRESNASAIQLAELNPVGELVIGSGETYDLGALFTPGMPEDLQFEFLLPGASPQKMQGRIIYQLAGDFNDDNRVDGLDFLEWQRGDRTAASLALWEQNYGSQSTSSTATMQVVPEPGASLLVLVSATLLMCFRTQKRRTSRE